MVIADKAIREGLIFVRREHDDDDNGHGVITPNNNNNCSTLTHFANNREREKSH